MTNEQIQENGFAAGVKAYHSESPYALSKIIKGLKGNAWGSPNSPYIVGYLQGCGEAAVISRKAGKE